MRGSNPLRSNPIVTSSVSFDAMQCSEQADTPIGDHRRSASGEFTVLFGADRHFRRSPDLRSPFLTALYARAKG